MGKKGAQNRIADVIFDLHTTTADTGVLLIMDRKDIFAHQIAQYVQKHHTSGFFFIFKWLNSFFRSLYSFSLPKRSKLVNGKNPMTILSFLPLDTAE